MPEKKDNVAEQVDQATDRFSMLKKAGLPVPLVIVLTLASTPGFYEFFFNKSGEVAEEKADVAYEVLVKEVEHLRDDDEDLEREIKNLRQLILVMYANGGGADAMDMVLDDYPTDESVDGSDETPEDAPVAAMDIKPTVPSGIKVGVARGSSQDVLMPPDVLADIVEQNQEPVAKQRKALPSLEDMVQRKQ